MGAATLAVVFIPHEVSAHGFGAAAAKSIADSALHSYVTTESTSAHRQKLVPLWRWIMTREYHSRTVMDTLEYSYGEYTSNVDVYWFVTPEIAHSDWRCMQWRDESSTPKRCERVRVRHPQSQIPIATDGKWSSAICHEVGHSVGFIDDPPWDNGCMAGGTVNAGVLSNHEIYHIDRCYADANWEEDC